MSFNPFTLWRWAYLTRYEHYLKFYDDHVARDRAAKNILGCALANIGSLVCVLIEFTGGIHLPDEAVIPLLALCSILSTAWISSYMQISEQLQPMWDGFVAEEEEQKIRRSRRVTAYMCTSFLVCAVSAVWVVISPRS